MRDASLCEDFGWHVGVISQGYNPIFERDPGFSEFWEQVCILNLERPGIGERSYYDGTGMWDAVNYLISGRRRTEAAGEPEWGDAAVRGFRKFPDTKAGISYSLASEVQDIAEFLSGITLQDLRRHYEPVDMERAGVYKFWADRADDEIWDTICELFEEIRAVHLKAAKFGEAILVIEH